MKNYKSENSEIRNYQNTIFWKFRTPINSINSYKSTLKVYYILFPILNLSLILLITQFDLFLTIINSFLHIVLFYSTLISFKEYHHYHMRKKILKQIKINKFTDENYIPKSELEILNYTNSTLINRYKILQLAFILLLLILSIAILDMNNTAKGYLTLILLIPIYFANNKIVLKEKIEFNGCTRVDFLKKQITVEGKLNHKFHEKINIEDIKEICFVDYSPLGDWWSIFSIVLSTKHFRIPAGDFYSKHFNHNFDEIFSLLLNEFKNYKLNNVNFLKMTKSEYSENKKLRVSIRVFVK
ncbi:MAG: hypothetical protein GPJ54_04875 [Candidatus Heimdallarchaeota archaeon]|nr:hypothetical protein [Candidatus Heimdallarchaeota archaeon]